MGADNAEMNEHGSIPARCGHGSLNLNFLTCHEILDFCIFFSSCLMISKQLWAPNTGGWPDLVCYSLTIPLDNVKENCWRQKSSPHRQVPCIYKFSESCKGTPTRKQVKGGRAYLDSQFQGVESVVAEQAGAHGHWLHCLYSREAEREHWHDSTLTLYSYPVFEPLGWCPLTTPTRLECAFPPHLTQSRKSLLDIPRGLSPKWP